MNIQEAAEKAGVGASTMRRYCLAGAIPAELTAEGYEIDPRDVQRWLSGVKVSHGRPGERYHVYSTKGITVRLSEVQLAGIFADYSNAAGTPKHIDQIVRKYGMTRQGFGLVRRLEGLTHTSLPFTDAEIDSAEDDDLVDRLRSAKKQRVTRAADAKVYRDMEKAAGLWYDRKAAMDEAARVMVGGLRESLPTPTPALPRLPVTSEHMMVMFPTDFHLGKRGSPDRGPGVITLAQSVDRLYTHTHRCVENARRAFGSATTIRYFFGSDWNNCDNATGATTRGTPQDNYQGGAELAQTSLRVLFDHIESLRGKGPIELCARPGNHDDYWTRLSSEALMLIYRDAPDVTIRPMIWEYGVSEWGRTMILDTHGHGRQKTTDLAQIMSTYFPDVWARCPFRYAIRGNLHHTNDDEAGGIRNLLFGSLSSSDAYHALHWPVQPRPLIRTPVFSKEAGMVANFESGVEWDGQWRT